MFPTSKLERYEVKGLGNGTLVVQTLELINCGLYKNLKPHFKPPVHLGFKGFHGLDCSQACMKLVVGFGTPKPVTAA